MYWNEWRQTQASLKGYPALTLGAVIRRKYDVPQNRLLTRAALI
jgi:hypothetical protein